MTDETNNSPQLGKHSIPVAFQIPAGLIESWTAIPERASLTINFTRQDIDNLFFAITSAAQATHMLQQTIIHHSHGRINEANEALAESQRKNIDGDNYVRMFISSIMASVKQHG